MNNYKHIPINDVLKKYDDISLHAIRDVLKNWHEDKIVSFITDFMPLGDSRASAPYTLDNLDIKCKLTASKGANLVNDVYLRGRLIDITTTVKTEMKTDTKQHIWTILIGFLLLVTGILLTLWLTNFFT